MDLYELTSDKALKIKNKNFIKDQIRNELIVTQKEGEDNIAGFQEPIFSPSHLSEDEEREREEDDQKYEEESDVFHIRKVTVTDTRQQTTTVTNAFAAAASSSSSSFFLPPAALPPPSSESPANGSESVYSTMSSSHNTFQNKTEYVYSQEETPIVEPPETPVEGGNSIYHSFLQTEEEDNPSDTPGFHDLQRLPARERSRSISESSNPESSTKRPRLEWKEV